MIELVMPGEIHPMRAEAPGGAKRHGRVDAVAPGDVIGGGHDPPLSTPHDHRLAPQGRVPVLLYRGKEGVEIEVSDDPVRGPGPKRLLKSEAPAAGMHCWLGSAQALGCLSLLPFHTTRIYERLFGGKEK
jgi:hypothetical protein